MGKSHSKEKRRTGREEEEKLPSSRTLEPYEKKELEESKKNIENHKNDDVLFVSKISVANVPKADLASLSDPFLIVGYHGLMERTSTAKNAKEASWDVHMAFFVDDSVNQNIEIRLLDDDLIGSDYLGYDNISIKDLNKKGKVKTIEGKFKSPPGSKIDQTATYSITVQRVAFSELSEKDAIALSEKIYPSFKEMPGPPRTLFLGNLPELLQGEIFDRVVEWNKQYGDFGVFWAGNIPTLYVTDPDILIDITATNSKDFYKTDPGPQVEPISRYTLFINNYSPYPRSNPPWDVARKRFPLAMKSIEEFFELYAPKIDVYLQRELKNLQKHQWHDDFWHVTNRMTFDLMTVGYVNDLFEEEVYHDATLLMYWLNERFVSKIVPAFDYTGSKGKAVKNFKKILIQKFNERKQHRPDQPECLFDLLVRDGTELEGQVLEDELTMLWAGGLPPVATSLVNCFVEIQKNPECYEFLVKEIKEMEEENNGNFQYGDLKKMKYLDMFLKEVLRLWPVVSLFSRNTNPEKILKISNYEIPGNTKLILCPWGIHRNERYWENPLKFDPERFRDEAKIKKGTYVPFGYGDRECIGRFMATTIMKFALISILRTHRVVVHNISDHSLKFFAGATKPKKALDVTFRNLNEDPIPEERELIEYSISLEVGDFKNASYNDVAHIKMYGENGNSSVIKFGPDNIIKKLFRFSDLERGSSHIIKTKQRNLGKIWQVRIWMNEAKRHDFQDWYLSQVLVTSEHGNKFHFPVYRWLRGHSINQFLESSGLIKCSATDKYHAQCEDELENARAKFQWYFPSENLPGHVKTTINELDKSFTFSKEKLQDLVEQRKKAITQLGIAKLLDAFDPWDSVDDFKGLYKTMKVPSIVSHWKEDEIFGDLRLRGPNPAVLKKIYQIPENFAITNDQVKQFLKTGANLDDELKNGKIFLLDYKILDGDEVKCNPGKYICAPLCLLYLNEQQKLVPIAIQLHQEANPDWNPIWTPADSENDWLFAKMWVSNADFCYHQILSNFFGTHFISEVSCVAMHRSIPSQHPVYKLLQPHFKYQLAINALNRLTLLPKEMPEIVPITYESIVTIMEKKFQEFSFEELNPINEAKSRNIEVSDLPNYWYLDDAVMIWNSIHDFISEMLSQTFKSDEQVKMDTYLQNFCKEGSKGFRGHGWPSKLDTVQDLVRLCTAIVFNATAQHAAVTFLQWEVFSFIPAAPGSLHLPPPGWGKTKVAKGKVDMKRIVRALPNKDASAKQMAIMWTLSQFSESELLLGTFDEQLFPEEFLEGPNKKLKDRLAEIGKKIRDRPGVSWLKDGYTVLDPSRIPNSTSI